MIIPTTDNITKFHTFTAQNWFRNARHVMCLLLVLPLIACGSGGTGTGSSGVDLSGNDGMGSGGAGTGPSNDGMGSGGAGTGPSNDGMGSDGGDATGMGSGGNDGVGSSGNGATDTVDQTFVDYLKNGDLTLNNFLKTDTGKAEFKDGKDHLGFYLNSPRVYPDITDLAIESDSTKSIKITVKEVIEDYLDDTTKQKTGSVTTLSYTDPDAVAGRFLLKEGVDEWGQGLFSSNSDGSTVMGLVSKEQLSQDGRGIDRVLVVTGKEYAWDNVDEQSGMYTFGGKALTTAVGYKSISYGEGQNSNDVWFTMTLETPTTEQTATKSLPAGADATLSITNWHLNDDINAADKNFLPLPAAVSLKGGVGFNNLRLVKGDGVNYIDERFLSFGTVKDFFDRRGGNRKGRLFDTGKTGTDFYTTDVYTSSITARLYGEPGSLAKNKAVIAGTYYVFAKVSSGGDYDIIWGVYILKQQ